MNERPTILIVDDEHEARETLEAQLYSEGYRLEFASNGREALERLSQDSVDLVLCDIMMPHMDGFEVCRAIKAHAEWRFVPVILITALDGEDDVVRGLKEGADEFLTKPVRQKILRARIRSMLRVRHQYDDLRAATPDLETLLRKRHERIVTEAKLSERERQVLDLLLLGRNHQEIGLALGITPRTSKFHQANILGKLGADSRVDLLRLFL